jgi:L-lactate dehydrogenase
MASRISIIGANVAGATAAYALLRDSVCDEILLVDTKVDRRDGQIRDLCDAASCENSSTRIRAGTHGEAGQSDIVVITAASKMGVGKTLCSGISKAIC